jgi:quercetin dioxygenase-like cupin family protein
MKTIHAAAVSPALLGGAPAFAENSVISPNGSRPNVSGPAQNFTGAVVVEPLYPHKETLRSTGGHVTFAPGARSAWHTHPAGQVLIVTDGVGWVQEEGGAKREIKPGDVVWCPPASSTGTAPPRRLECATSPSQARSTARMSIGWNRSPTSSIGSKEWGRGRLLRLRP